MAITKAKKTEIIERGKKELEAVQILLFADFQGTKVQELRVLRKVLKGVNAKLKVVKKRLLKIVLKDKEIDFDPLKFERSVGTIFSTGDLAEVTQAVYQFAKEHSNFKILGGFDVQKKEEIPLATIVAIGNLLPREIVLSQLLGALTSPLRGLMYILQEKSKRSAVQ